MTRHATRAMIALAVLRAYFPGATAADLVRVASSRPNDT